MVGEERFSLRWNDFERSLSGSFQQFRSDLVDVEIFCCGSVVMAHRLVLCACSLVLRDMILKCSHTKTSPALLLLDVDTKELECLLDFMYTGEVSVQQDRLPLFLQLAEKLQVAGLTQTNEKDTEDMFENEKNSTKQHQLKKNTEKVDKQYQHPQKQYQSLPQKQYQPSAQQYEEVKPQKVSYEKNDKIDIDTEEQPKDEEEVLIDPPVVKSEVAEASNNYPMYVYEGYEGYDEDVGENYYNSKYNERTAEGEFPCHLCGKVYKTSGSLKNHRSLYHRDHTSKYQSHKNKPTLPPYTS